MLKRAIGSVSGGGGTVTDLIPTMTSNTTPSGKVTYLARDSASHDGFYAFDNNKNTYCGDSSSGSSPNYYNWVAYTFDAPVKATLAVVIPFNYTESTSEIYIEGSNNHVDWQTEGDFTRISEIKTCPSSGVCYFELNPTQAYRTYRVYMKSSGTRLGCFYFQIFNAE